MALDLGTIFVKIGAKNDELMKALSKSEQALEKFGSKMEGIGRTLSLRITAPLAAIGYKATQMAGEVVESENLFSVAMGKMETAGRKFTNAYAKSLGLNEYEMRKQMGTFKVMAESMGLTEQAAYDLSQGFTTLAYDLASFYNISFESAFEKLQSGMVGMVMPLRELGININETTVEAYALREGIIKQGESLTESGKVLARYGAIMEQARKAQGNLAREIDNPLSKQRILQEQVKALTKEFGDALLPMFNKLLDVAGKVVEKLKDMTEAFKNLSPEAQEAWIKVGLFVALLGPASLLIGGVAKTIGTLATLFGGLGTAISVVVGFCSKLSFAFTAWTTGAATLGEAMAFLLGPIGILVAALAVVYGLYKAIDYLTYKVFNGHYIDYKMNKWLADIDFLGKGEVYAKKAEEALARHNAKQTGEEVKDSLSSVGEEVGAMFNDLYKDIMKGLNFSAAVNSTKEVKRSIQDIYDELEKKLAENEIAASYLGNEFDQATANLDAFRDAIMEMARYGIAKDSSRLATEIYQRYGVALKNAVKDTAVSIDDIFRSLQQRLEDNKNAVTLLGVGNFDRWGANVEAYREALMEMARAGISKDSSDSAKKIYEGFREALRNAANMGKINAHWGAKEFSLRMPEGESKIPFNPQTLEDYMNLPYKNVHLELPEDQFYKYTEAIINARSATEDLNSAFDLGLINQRELWQGYQDMLGGFTSSLVSVYSSLDDSKIKDEIGKMIQSLDADKTTLKVAIDLKNRLEFENKLRDSIAKAVDPRESLKAYSDALTKYLSAGYAEDSDFATWLQKGIESATKQVGELDFSEAIQEIEKGLADGLTNIALAEREALAKGEIFNPDKYKSDLLDKAIQQKQSLMLQEGKLLDEVIAATASWNEELTALTTSIKSSNYAETILGISRNLQAGLDRSSLASDSLQYQASLYEQAIVQLEDAMFAGGKSLDEVKSATAKWKEELKQLYVAMDEVSKQKRIDAIKDAYTQATDATLLSVEEQIAKAMGESFDPKVLRINALRTAIRQTTEEMLKQGKAQEDIQAAIKEWLNELNNLKPDIFREWATSLRQDLLGQLPIASRAYSMGESTSKAYASTGGSALEGGITGALIALVSESDTFKTILANINPILQSVADALGRVIEPLLPIAVVLSDTLTPILEVLGAILNGVLEPALATLFPIIKLLGVAMLNTASIINWGQLQFAKMLSGITQWLSGLPLIGSTFKSLADASKAKVEELNNRQTDLSQSMKDLIDLTYDEAKAKAKLADTAREVSEALRNVPSGFKIALRRYQVSDPTTGSYQPTSQTPIFVNFNGPIFGMDDFKREVKGIWRDTIRSNSLALNGI